MVESVSKEREVDARGNCSKCGGTHYGTGWYCPMSAEPGDEARVKAVTPDAGVASAPEARGSVTGAPLSSKHSSTWFRVEVHDEGGPLVAIEPEMLAGRPVTEGDADTIRRAIRHLQGFIGAPDETPGWQSMESAPKDQYILALVPVNQIWMSSVPETKLRPVVVKWGGDYELWGMPGLGGLKPVSWRSIDMPSPLKASACPTCAAPGGVRPCADKWHL